VFQATWQSLLLQSSTILANPISQIRRLRHAPYTLRYYRCAFRSTIPRQAQFSRDQILLPRVQAHQDHHQVLSCIANERAQWSPGFCVCGSMTKRFCDRPPRLLGGKSLRRTWPSEHEHFGLPVYTQWLSDSDKHQPGVEGAILFGGFRVTSSPLFRSMLSERARCT